MTTQETKPIPTPWQHGTTNGEWQTRIFLPLYSGGLQLIAEAFDNQGRCMDLARANAAYIVRACNAHDALVEALESAQKMLNYLQEIQLGDAPRGCGPEAIRIAQAHDMLKITAALALAQGEK